MHKYTKVYRIAQAQKHTSVVKFYYYPLFRSTITLCFYMRAKELGEFLYETAIISNNFATEDLQIDVAMNVIGATSTT